jgi:membrane protein implicated in regulation of membrane protease activity
VHWWLIAGIIVLALGAFAILICVFVCVARRYAFTLHPSLFVFSLSLFVLWLRSLTQLLGLRYNRSLQEDKIKEREEKRARNERQSVNPAGATRIRGDEESSSGEEATAAQTEQRVWRRPDLTAEEETDPLLRFVYKKKTI